MTEMSPMMPTLTLRATLLLVLLSAPQAAEAAEQKPNIVFILSPRTRGTRRNSLSCVRSASRVLRETRGDPQVLPTISVAEWAKETPAGWKDVLPLLSKQNAAKGE